MDRSILMKATTKYLSIAEQDMQSAPSTPWKWARNVFRSSKWKSCEMAEDQDTATP